MGDLLEQEQEREREPHPKHVVEDQEFVGDLLEQQQEQEQEREQEHEQQQRRRRGRRGSPEGHLEQRHDDRVFLRAPLD